MVAQKRGLIRTAAPDRAVISLTEFKDFARITGDDDDEIISSFINAAIDEVESILGACLVTQEWRMTLDNFPCTHKNMWWDGVKQMAISELNGGYAPIDLGKWPVVSVDEIVLTDINGDETTVNSGVYLVDTVSKPGRVALKSGQVWPVTALQEMNGISIEFTAGFGAPEFVPNDLKTAVKMIAAHMYDNRGCVDCASACGAMSIIERYKVARI